LELFEMRNHLVSEVSNQLGPSLSTVIAYSEVAREVSLEEATMDGPDLVYGSNLQHGLLMARLASRRTSSDRILLVTYSLPSAHHVPGGGAFFMEPPIIQSLDAARREAASVTSDELRLDIMMVVAKSDESRTETVNAFFVPLAEAVGGSIESVLVGQETESVVSRIIHSGRRRPVS
jgi:uncharacterized protein with von Willebrand factor type A (vWA) domain